MTSPDSSTNPDPETTTGLEPGTGVAPGDTPPAEASATAGLGEVHQPVPKNSGSTFPILGVVLGVAILVLLVAVVVWAIFFG
ncbi:MAG: DUF6480 family protein [Mycobacteriaceae bacterium]